MEIVVYVLPSIVAFVFAGLLHQRKCRTLAERFMLMFVLVTGLFLLFDAYVVYPNTFHVFKPICLIGSAFLVPTIGITICFVGWSLYSVKQRYRPQFLAFYLAPIGLFLLEIFNYTGFGFMRAAEYFASGMQLPAECETDSMLRHMYQIFEFVAIYVYNLSCTITYVIAFLFMLYVSWATDLTPMVLFNFFFRRGPIRTLHMLLLASWLMDIFFVVRIVLTSQYLSQNPNTGMLLYAFGAIAMCVLGLASLRLRKPVLYLIRPHKQPMYDDVPVTILEHDNLEKTGVANNTALFDDDVEADSYRTLNVKDDLHSLMRDTACFLYPGQSRYHVAEMLGLRRDSLDRTMRVLFHISYEEYVMVQRVEYCRRYRDRYNSESEVEISMACGFVSLKEMQYEWRECRTYFRLADKYLEDEKKRLLQSTVQPQ